MYVYLSEHALHYPINCTSQDICAAASRANEYSCISSSSDLIMMVVDHINGKSMVLYFLLRLRPQVLNIVFACSRRATASRRYFFRLWMHE